MQADKKDRAFLGHPIGLAWLSGSEFWERFSYYGMQALLVLYLSKWLLLPGHIEHVWGIAPFRAFIARFTMSRVTRPAFDSVGLSVSS